MSQSEEQTHEQINNLLRQINTSNERITRLRNLRTQVQEFHAWNYIKYVLGGDSSIKQEYLLAGWAYQKMTSDERMIIEHLTGVFDLSPTPMRGSFGALQDTVAEAITAEISRVTADIDQKNQRIAELKHTLHE